MVVIPEPTNSKQKWLKLADNLLYIVNGKSIHFKVDLTKEQGLSKSEKSMIIASSKGNKAVDLADGRSLKVGINIYESV